MKRVAAGLGLLGLISLVALLAPLLATHSPTFVPEGSGRLSPNSEHWFGTDILGRDVFARTLFGARTSLAVGAGAALLACVIGAVVGIWSGWHRGWRDALATRATEVFLVLPSILVAASILLVTGRSIATLILVIGFTMWPIVARVARAETIRVVSLAFVDAAVTAGMSRRRIIWRHVAPHVLPAIAVVAAASVGTAIIAEASLSFLGIGVVEPTPSWGLMVFSGRGTLTSAPHIVLFPSVAIMLTVLGFSLLSSGLRSALAVKK